MSQRVALSLMIALAWVSSALAGAPYETVSLNGVWQIADGRSGVVPQRFEHQVQVPGLVDMATPPFPGVGFEGEPDRVFWYRRTFHIDGAIPEYALLKIHKAKYGLRVIVNGQAVGEHLPCFTPGYFNVKKALKGNGAANQLLISVGAHRTSLPASIPSGWDFEKYKYIPGIYDDVEIILADSPRIVNVQIVPNIDQNTIRVVTELASARQVESPVRYTVREAKSRRVVGQLEKQTRLSAGGATTLNVDIEITDCHLWAPEDPFLYELEVVTGGDRTTSRFGMRSFRLDPATGRAILNGKPYFMRGTNVCILRFFEDEARGMHPWDKQWVRRLHEKFKYMHWNSARYCIGFPPDFWYDIADEVGILVQDEFPIWHLNPKRSVGGWPQQLRAPELAKEYRDWMRQRWNHPCVVIWDAQNETFSDGETGKAIQQVRHLDLSNRPWDNGWEANQAAGDPREAHPYLYIQYWSGKGSFKLADLATTSGRPRLPRAHQESAPIILNEYAWLWLNRDGTTTGLTHNVYRHLLGPQPSIPQLRYTYARHLAALTEFWRSHRQCAAVMHFCGLAYSRPGGVERPASGATSDHFVDLAALNLEPNFEVFVRDAFAPIGIMIDKWEATYRAGDSIDVPVAVINDLADDWQGTVRLLVKDAKDEVVTRQEKSVQVAGLGRSVVLFKARIPDVPEHYQFVAELVIDAKTSVRSLRDFEATRLSQNP